MLKLAIVTATTNPARAKACLDSWAEHATLRGTRLFVVENGLDDLPYAGSVPAFEQGVNEALDTDADVIACLHDDLTIHEQGWDMQVIQAFTRFPDVGLAGFGGAIGLGADGIYREPYDPMQLARMGFRSNLSDAEHHGIRRTYAEEVVCLDGFSQIGRRGFFLGESRLTVEPQPRPWTHLKQLGFVHHFYDSALGCLARRQGWTVRFLPVRCTHHGGQTAVGDPGYQAWAATQTEGGDRGFWESAHRIGYDEFRDVLPLRLHRAFYAT